MKTLLIHMQFLTILNLSYFIAAYLQSSEIATRSLPASMKVANIPDISSGLNKINN